MGEGWGLLSFISQFVSCPREEVWRPNGLLSDSVVTRSYSIQAHGWEGEGGDSKSSRSAELIFFFRVIQKSARSQTKRGGGEGRDRTQFLWRKPSQTEAHLPAAPPLGTSMSRPQSPSSHPTRPRALPSSFLSEPRSFRSEISSQCCGRRGSH